MSSLTHRAGRAATIVRRANANKATIRARSRSTSRPRSPAPAPEQDSDGGEDEMTRLRRVLAPPPIPGVPDYGIPPAPPGAPPPALTVRALYSVCPR